MHEVLRNWDLVYQIFEWLEDDREALLAGALTCHTFRKPAQDILWRYIDQSLAPLLALLPVHKPSGYDDWRLEETVQPLHLERVTHLARQVRALSPYRSHKAKSFDPSVLMSFLIALPPPEVPTLFRNLRELHLAFDTYRGPTPGIFQLAYSANLKAVRFYCSGSFYVSEYGMREIAFFIRRLQSDLIACQIQRFEIIFQSDQGVFDAIPSFTNLRSLELYGNKSVVFRYTHLVCLSMLRDLSKLVIGAHYFDNGSVNQGWTASMPGSVQFKWDPFRMLRDLTVVCPLAAFIDMLSTPFSHFPNLSRLKLCISLEQHHGVFNIIGLISARSWALLFSTLSTAATALKRVEIRAQELSWTRWEDANLDKGVFLGVGFEENGLGMDLCQMSPSRLEEFVVGFPLFRVLELNDFKAMGQAWGSSLTTLHLPIVGIPEDDATAPQTGMSWIGYRSAPMRVEMLPSIAAYFPNLKSLQIDIDVDALPNDLPPLRGDYEPVHGLERLEMRLRYWRRGKKKVETVAMYVYTAFPALQVFSPMMGRDCGKCDVALQKAYRALVEGGTNTSCSEAGTPASVSTSS
ncbi:hypothetical protein CVT24_005117 [Panaeolus cyanescens]|uniref:F-box domain-containing protein n=1 Tax=Panaeolus cyanescens TaxID=181874 RepID=A0A409W2A2_9AGAR|nr:hypothetical protein CVT24_005117 [Panaeolus cyanescens]